MVKVKVKKLKEGAIIPRYVRPGDVAMDLHSCEDYLVKAGERVLVSTGVAFEFPEGYAAFIWGRSGLAVKRGICILAGAIEYTYRGECGVVLLNTGDVDFEIRKGDRIAQVVFQKVSVAEVEEVLELGESVRGENGFGSSGGTSV